MNEQNLTAQLKDIKPLLEIPDYSFYYYWGAITIVVFFVSMLLFFVIKKYIENRKKNLSKHYLEELKNIDWNNSKEASYKATHYGRLLANDERSREIFSQLQPMLEQFKYKKSVDEVDEKTRNQFDLFVRVINESI